MPHQFRDHFTMLHYESCWYEKLYRLKKLNSTISSNGISNVFESLNENFWKTIPCIHSCDYNISTRAVSIPNNLKIIKSYFGIFRKMLEFQIERSDIVLDLLHCQHVDTQMAPYINGINDEMTHVSISFIFIPFIKLYTNQNNCEKTFSQKKTKCWQIHWKSSKYDWTNGLSTNSNTHSPRNLPFYRAKWATKLRRISTIWMGPISILRRMWIKSYENTR